MGALRDKVSRKLIILPSGDQDDTGAAYIRPNRPEVKEYQFTGINFGYGAQDRAAPEDKIYFTPDWTRQNIFAAAQNDFAARMQWSVTPRFSDANHPPNVGIKGPLEISARAGATVPLEGEVSDPDHDTATVTWWQLNDAGTYPGDISLSEPAALATTFRVPEDAKPGQTIHVILEATDHGNPPLTRYQRVIVTVQ